MGVMAEDKIVMKRINEIRPYMRNPRQNEKTVELLCKLIPKVGFNVPLVIDEKGVIVKGHARFAAAIRLGMEELPCIVTHADSEAIKLDRITDNKIAEYSEWINEEVAAEIDSINSDIDFSDLGFPSVKFDEMPDAKELEREIEVGVAAEAEKAGMVEIKPIKKYYKCVCKDCGHVMFVDASKIAKIGGKK